MEFWWNPWNLTTGPPRTSPEPIWAHRPQRFQLGKNELGDLFGPATVSESKGGCAGTDSLHAARPRPVWRSKRLDSTLVQVAKGCWDFNFLPTNWFSIKPLKVKLLAEEQKSTESRFELAHPNEKASS